MESNAGSNDDDEVADCRLNGFLSTVWVLTSLCSITASPPTTGFQDEASLATNVFEQQEQEDQQDQQLGPKRGYNHLPLRADGLLDNGVVWRGPASVGDLNLLSGSCCCSPTMWQPLAVMLKIDPGIGSWSGQVSPPIRSLMGASSHQNISTLIDRTECHRKPCDRIC